MEIYIGKNGEKSGPFSLEVVKAKLANGEVSAFDLAWHEGLSEWKPLGSIAGLAANAEMPPPLVAPPAAPQTSPLAVASLVCGIAGIPLALVCGIFGLIVPVTAIVCGHLAAAQIRESKGKQEGKGLVRGGLITGYAALVLYILFLLAMFGFIVFGIWHGRPH